MNTRFAIVNTRLVDPVAGTETTGGLLVQDRRIAALGAIDTSACDQIIDAGGKALAPGLIDSGVFKAERAAASAGGITRVMLMPDQSPPLDDPALIERAERLGKPELWVHPLAAATRGLDGEELAEIGLCQLAGAVGAATGRHAIASTLVMMRLLQYATRFDMVVVTHAEDGALTAGNVATSGDYASRMGLPSSPAMAEALAVARDVRLAEETGARLHIRQISTTEGLDIVRRAKARGVRVTCGANPAHFLLNDQAVAGYRTFTRLSPPLREERDRLALRAAVIDGTVDVLTSSHDPRGQDDKRLPFAEAEPGMVGMETLLPLALTLHHDGELSLAATLALLSSRPAAIFGTEGGQLAVGAPADLVMFDPDSPWRIQAERFRASAGNTPFDLLPVQGRVLATWKGGEQVFSAQ